jgi:hypothetical protein
VATDQAWSGEEAKRFTSNTRMSNFQSDMDHRSVDPSGSLSAVDLRNHPRLPNRPGTCCATTPTGPCLRLSVELDPLDERVCGK